MTETPTQRRVRLIEQYAPHYKYFSADYLNVAAFSVAAAIELADAVIAATPPIETTVKGGNMKIIINTRYGGFGFSAEAEKRIREALNVGPMEYVDWDMLRTDSRVIAIVEKLGCKAASSNLARLKIIEIPNDVDWEIWDHDGIERVFDKKRSWD